MHSFYDFHYVKSLSLSHVSRLLHQAFEKKEERKAWDMWIARFAHMDKESFIPFSEFLTSLRKPPIKESNESVEETFNRFRMRVKQTP